MGKGIIYRPESRNEFYQSINVLETNNILDIAIVKKIKKFREERNKSIHGIFKDMTRRDWEKQNVIVVEQGRVLANELDEKLARY